jgi:hypothetical protein
MLQNAYGTMDEHFIYHWDEPIDKSRCFDFSEFLGSCDIENNLGIDVGTILYFSGDISMRDHADNNGI